MNDLKQRNNIFIIKADKGGAVVMIDVKDYIKEVNRQLGNTQFYSAIDKDLTNKHNKMINDLIDRYIGEK